MSETDSNNPYASPGANVAREEGATMGGLIENGRAVDAGRGTAWISAGFEIFMKAPGMWVLIALVYMIVSVVAGAIPFLGALAMGLLGSVFMAGMLLGCQTLENGGALDVSTLFEGFKRDVGQLVMVNVLGMVGMVVIAIVIGVIIAVFGGLGALGGRSGFGMMAVAGMLIAMLLGFALMVPVVMAIWFAPALVVFHGVDAVSAAKQSFAACLKNMIPFLIWGAICFVLAIVAMIPLGLGFLVLGPVLVGSLYVSYKEIFCE